MTEMLFASFEDPGKDMTLFIEDDGRVAYAYLSQDRRIVADLWLYNRLRAPAAPEWDTRPPGDSPYLNPREFVHGNPPFAIPENEAQISVLWLSDSKGKRGARIFSDGKLIGELFEGDKPGKALAAKKSGPLALSFP